MLYRRISWLSILLCLTLFLCGTAAADPAQDLTASCSFYGSGLNATTSKQLYDGNAKTSFRLAKAHEMRITSAEGDLTCVHITLMKAPAMYTVQALHGETWDLVRTMVEGSDDWYMLPEGTTAIRIGNISTKDELALGEVHVYGAGELPAEAVETPLPEVPDHYTFVYEDGMSLRVAELARFVDDPERFKGMEDKTTGYIDAFNAAFDALHAEKPDIPVYLYLCETSATLDLSSKEIDPNSPFYLDLTSRLHLSAHDHLKFTDIETYFSCFTSTDHHWNYRGSYQAYLDIIHMIFGEDIEDYYIPTGTRVFPFVYNGSHAKSLKQPISTEPFTVYTFDGFPCYTCKINGKKSTYGRYESYMNGHYSTYIYDAHYALFYGGDKAVITFTNESAADAPDLLIIGNSFTNAVQTLLAKHYHTIVSIDPRHINQNTFSLSEFVEEYGIDQILLLSDIKLYTIYDYTVLP